MMKSSKALDNKMKQCYSAIVKYWFVILMVF